MGQERGISNEILLWQKPLIFGEHLAQTEPKKTCKHQETVFHHH